MYNFSSSNNASNFDHHQQQQQYHHQQHHPSVFPSSLNQSTTINNLIDGCCNIEYSNSNNSTNSDVSIINNSGPIPISPHVNVPNYNSCNNPPPLPPRLVRRDRKEVDAVFIAQTRQAPDAPQVILIK